MQANPLSTTALDNPANGIKSSKSNASIAPEISFNQILGQEMSSSRVPDSIPVKTATTPSPPAKTNSSNSTNNTANATNNNNNTNNATGNTADAKTDTSQSTSTAATSAQPPAKTDKSDASDSKTDKDDDAKSKTDTNDIGSQIIALVGNINAPIPIDAGKKTDASKTDAGKAGELTATDQLSVDNQASSNTLDALTQAAQNSLDKTSGTANPQGVASSQQSSTDDATSKTDFAAIAAQLIASKTDGKSADKSSVDATKTTTALPTTDKATLLDADAKLATSLSNLSKETTTSTTQATRKSDKTLDTSSLDVKSKSVDISNKLADKTTDTRPAVTPADTPKSIATDIAQAKDALSLRSAEGNVNMAKEIQATPNAAAVAPAIINVAPINAASSLAAEQITQRVGSNGWDKAVGQKVVWMVGEGLQSAELTLNPPDLGPLQVVLKVSNDQANASFTSAQPEVREALEAALPRLRQMLSDAGVQLTGFSVNSQASGQGQNFAQQQPRTVSTSRSSGGADNTSIASVASSPVQVKTNNGLVDTFA